MIIKQESIQKRRQINLWRQPEITQSKECPKVRNQGRKILDSKQLIAYCVWLQEYFQSSDGYQRNNRRHPWEGPATPSARKPP